MSQAPIGIFDSGIGGLSVLRSLIKALPGEDFIYLGDTARLPYGNKSPKTIANYVQKNADYLERLDIKALVVACNSASSVVVKDGLLADNPFKIPIYNVIEPAAHQASLVSENNKIGVLGTRATISSQVYVKAIAHHRPKAEVYQQACPLFVPIVEEGWTDDPLTNLIVYRYLSPVTKCEVDTIILGCTHYPFLKGAIRKVTGHGVQLIDSADAVAEKLKTDMEQGLVSKSSKDTGEWKILTTDNNELFSHLAEQFMEQPLPHPIEQVDI